MKKINRREFLRYSALLGAAGAGSSLLAACGPQPLPAATATPAPEVSPTVAPPSGEPIRIGALLPMTGFATWSGQMMLDCTQLAVNEIHAAGGLLGRPVEIVLEDTETNPEKAVAKAERLILEEKVDAIIGTLFSSVRNAVKVVTEENRMLLLNPTYYEGKQCGKYFFSTGAVPNQQFDAYVPWLVGNVGSKFYLVGSDYEWPRGSFAGLKPVLEEAGGELVGEEYVPLGNTEWSALIRRVADAKPDICFELVAGSDGVAFTNAFYDFGLTETIAQAYSGVSEAYTNAFSPAVRDGLYSYVDYLMAIDTPENQAFLEGYRAIAGQAALVEMIPEHQYENTRLYGLAVELAGTTDKDAVAEALTEVTFQGPAGPVSFSKENHHANLTCFIARCDRSNNYEILLKVENVAPEPMCTV